MQQQPEANGGKVPWELFYGEMRDLRSVLEETRDAMQDIHGRFDSLPCADHEQRVQTLTCRVADIRRNVLPWRPVLDAVFDRKLIVGILVGLIGLLGAGEASKWLEVWLR